jgi:ABC-type transport system involved in multi-copper enzyme maturation permease subunit
MKKLWVMQVVAIVRLELRKTFFAKRGLWIYLLALLPVVIFGSHSIEMMIKKRPCDFGQDTNIFATVFQILNLRLVLFFGCLGIFINLFRGEVLDRSLHYYFLAPVRREVLVVGKYLAGLLAAVVIFTTGTLLQWTVLQLHFPRTVVMTYLNDGNGWSHVFAYAGATMLACVGYGSVFLLAGAIFKNPIVPAALVAIWEGISAFLPGLLQKFSVTYYLKSLLPIEATPDIEPPFSMLVVNADPISPVVAVLGMVLFTAFVLVIAAVKVRRMEIAYGTE